MKKNFCYYSYFDNSDVQIKGKLEQQSVSHIGFDDWKLIVAEEFNVNPEKVLIYDRGEAL